MNLGPQKISDTYKFVLNQSGGSVTLGDGTTPNWIGTTIVSATGTQTISGTKTFQNNSIFNGNLGVGTSNPNEKIHINNGSLRVNDTYIKEWTSSNTDIDGLINGSTAGSLLEGRGNAHFTIGLRSNDIDDGFQILSKEAAADPYNDSYTKNCFEVKADGRTIIGPAGNGKLTLEVKGGIRAQGGAPGANGANDNGYAFGSPGDSDAGMFSSSDNNLEFYTNNTERMRISGPNVGIGENNPKTRLVVDGEITSSSVAGNNGNFRSIGTNYGAFFRTDGTRFYLLFTNSGDQYGTWNTLRPFYAELANGNMVMGENLTVSKTTTTNGFKLGSQSNKATISYTTDIARTFTIPSVDQNSTFAFINQAQTFSADQVIDADLRVQGNLDFGSSTLGGTATSSFFKTNAGQLGTTSGNTLNLASIGFLSTNNTSLSFIARRQSNGTDWQSSSIGLTYNVDAVTGVGPGGSSNIQEIWMLPNGNVGLGKNNPTEKLEVQGNLKVNGSITANSVVTNTFSLTTAQNSLTANVAMPTTNSWVDGPAVSLAAGKWLVQAHVTFRRAATTATTWFARITDGINHYASSQEYTESLNGVSCNVTLTSIITLASAATVKIQGTTSAGNANCFMLAQLSANASNNTATQITAVKIG